jgi:hypothetical protein
MKSKDPDVAMFGAALVASGPVMEYCKQLVRKRSG